VTDVSVGEFVSRGKRRAGREWLSARGAGGKIAALAGALDGATRNKAAARGSAGGQAKRSRTAAGAAADRTSAAAAADGDDGDDGEGADADADAQLPPASNASGGSVTGAVVSDAAAGVLSALMRLLNTVDGDSERFLNDDDVW
jgi:hypothetical protein